MRIAVLNNHNIGRTYGTEFIGFRHLYPGVKTTGLQYVSFLRNLLIQEASSGGTTDIVAMEFIPLNKSIR